jgi:hypothetical protein
VFDVCTSLTNVYYQGTAVDWERISNSADDENYLMDATLYYFSETQPTIAGNYWHYVEGVPTVWVYTDK